MFLKVSKKPNTIRCEIKKTNEWKFVQIGTIYSFSLVESCRSGKKTSHMALTGLGSYTWNEYEPLCITTGESAYGTPCRRVYVKSFDPEDPSSFRKVEQDPPIRFFHTFTRKLSAAASKHDIPTDKLRELISRVLKMIPLYTVEDYRSYMNEEIKIIIRQESSGGYGKDIRKLINQEMPYEVCDFVALKDGLFQPYRNIIKIKINYDFQLM